MKMRSDTSRSVQEKQRKIWGMNTLKMCFGKGRIKRHKSFEQGDHYIFSLS